MPNTTYKANTLVRALGVPNKTCAYITLELEEVSVITIWRILRKAGLKKTKLTRKPGLTKKIKRERLEFCIRYKD
jgi:hypothetical protein